MLNYNGYPIGLMDVQHVQSSLESLALESQHWSQNGFQERKKHNRISLFVGIRVNLGTEKSVLQSVFSIDSVSMKSMTHTI